MNKTPKISLIGAGNIGGTIAYICAEKQLGNIVLLDMNDGIAKGKALDISQAMTVIDTKCNIIGTNDHKDIKDSDVIIVTAGLARKPGMTRGDLLVKNIAITKDVAKNIKKNAPNAFVIVVTNPLDVITHCMLKETGFDKKKVVGMAGVLDSGRFRCFLAQELNVNPKDVNATIIGSHSDKMVIPLNQITIRNIPIQDFIEFKQISAEKLKEISERARNGGGEIVKHLVNGSAFYAPAASAVKMAEAYLKDQKRILPCAVKLEGEYDTQDVCACVPVVIGKDGIEEIIKMKLDSETKKEFDDSINSIKEQIKKIPQ